jgi:hypothetical protein
MGGLSKFNGSKGANQYQQFGIIRFELPFDGWCTKCKVHVSKGSRFNAHKDKDGKYLSTQIFAFTMKCASCDNEFVIKTDPQNRTYDFKAGIRKMEQDYEAGAEDSVVLAVTDEHRTKMMHDPIYKLQHEKEDNLKAQSAKERLTALHDLKAQYYKEDFESNRLLRGNLRKRKTHDFLLLEEGKKRHMSIALVDAHPDDDVAASKAVLKSRSCRGKFSENARVRLVQVQTESIFAVPNVKSPAAASTKAALRQGLRTSALAKQARSSINVNSIKVSVGPSALPSTATLQIRPAPSAPECSSDLLRCYDNLED